MGLNDALKGAARSAARQLLIRSDEPRTRSRLGVVLVVLSVSLALPLWADSAGPQVSIAVQVEREEVRLDEHGQQVVERRPVDVAHPGEVLVYTVKAANLGDGPALNTRIEDSIPQGTVLLLEAFEARNHPSGVSLDGGRTWQAFPARIKEYTDDGRQTLVPAPPEAYTHLRWVLEGPLQPGQTKDVSFKVQVK